MPQARLHPIAEEQRSDLTAAVGFGGADRAREGEDHDQPEQDLGVPRERI